MSKKYKSTVYTVSICDADYIIPSIEIRGKDNSLTRRHPVWSFDRNDDGKIRISFEWDAQYYIYSYRINSI